MRVHHLESKYIQHLEDTHYRGYAQQLLHDNERLYYKGMRQYFTDVLNDPKTLPGGF